MSTVQPPGQDSVMLSVRRSLEGKDGERPVSYRPESMTPAMMDLAREAVEHSGAFKPEGHFVHRFGILEEEFHTTTWFGSDAAFCDSAVMVNAIPAMVSKLGQIGVQSELVVGVVTGGAVMTGEMVRQLETVRLLDDEPLGCLFLRHDPENTHQYVLSNQARDWVKAWRGRHQGRSPRAVLLDDVLFSGNTTWHCVNILRSEGINVSSIAHLAEAIGMEFPKLIRDIPRVNVFQFETGPIYKRGRCPLCMARVPLTIV